MGKTVDQLFAMTAADIQTSPVITIPQTLSMRDAGLILFRSGISGAPVVDGEGRCVGVISATDFLPSECGKGQLSENTAPEARCCVTADPVMVGPAVRLRDLARMMVDAHIHRVIVIDDDRRPTGVVTSTDLLAVLAFSRESAAAARESDEESRDSAELACRCNH